MYSRKTDCIGYVVADEDTINASVRTTCESAETLLTSCVHECKLHILTLDSKRLCFLYQPKRKKKNDSKEGNKAAHKGAVDCVAQDCYFHDK